MIQNIRYVVVVVGMVFSVMRPAVGNELRANTNSVYQDKKRNIVISRDKEQQSSALNQGFQIPDSLESLSLGDVIIVDDLPKKPVDTLQPVVCKPIIINKDGKITDSDCGQDLITDTDSKSAGIKTQPAQAGQTPQQNENISENIQIQDIETQDTETQDIIVSQQVIPETHQQMVARLAAEADFFYTFGAPHKVFYPVSNPLPEPEPKMTLLQADTIGLYSPQTGGIMGNYWQDYTYVKVLNDLQQADSVSRSYVYNQVMNRVILSGTPIPKTNAQAGEIFAFRLQTLMNAGRLLDAQKLLDTIPYDMRITRYADTLAQIYIAYFDNASLCGLWYMQPDAIKKQAFWERINILCLTLDGNWDGVQKAFESIQNPLSEGFQALVEFGLKGTDIPSDTHIDINIWTVHLMRALGFGVDVPVDADMSSYYGLLQNLAVPDDQRAYYAYELFKQRSLPADFVALVYATVAPYEPIPNTGDMPFDVAIEDSITPIIRYADIPYHWRALSYQQAVRISQLDISTPNDNTEQLIDIVLQQIDAEMDYTNRITTVRLFAPFLIQIPVHKHPQSKRIAGVLYASGHYESAEQWAVQNPIQLWYERILYQILQSAPDTNHNIKQYAKNKGGCDRMVINPDAWMQYIIETDADNAVYRISEAFMTLESLGCQVGTTYWQQLADMTPLLIQDIIAPAHMRTLRVKYKHAAHILPVLFATKMFVDRVDISHMEMAKIYTMLYDMGYAKLATQIAYERNTYNPW